MRIESGTPVWIDPSDGEVLLSRLQTTDPRLQEALIQELVIKHPTVLPVGEIDPSFEPLIPIGREVGTSAGPLDALYINPVGHLTLVEAKLWRNPQARREVVGQIIDYATAIARWSYDDLDGICTSATGTGLWDLVRSHSPDDVAPEAEFVDTVARGLRNGRFLLLIVGDGIREEVERMAAYVQAAPQLQFTLGLIELKIYEHSDTGSRVVLPSIVARTEEVTRAVVHVDVAQEAEVSVSVTVPADDSSSSRRQLTLEQFHAELVDNGTGEQLAQFVEDVFDEFARDPRFFLQPGSASVSLRLRAPERSSASLTVLVFTREGTAYTGWIEGQSERYGIPVEFGLRYVRDVAAIMGRSMHHKYADTLDSAIPLDTLQAEWPGISERILQLADEVHGTAG